MHLPENLRTIYHETSTHTLDRTEDCFGDQTGDLDDSKTGYRFPTSLNTGLNTFLNLEHKDTHNWKETYDWGTGTSTDKSASTSLTHCNDLKISGGVDS